MRFRKNDGLFVRRAVCMGLAGYCITALIAQAELRMPKIFTDHMVLQQELPVAVWGWAEPGQKVTVSILTVSQSAVADAAGKWNLQLPALKAAMTASKPASLVIVAGSGKVELKDVLVGEVWLASGQSNMNRPVEGAAKDKANFPNIRLFTSNGSIPRRDELNGTVGWVPCSPESIVLVGHETGPGKYRPFSDVAYHFAMKLHQELKVPVGVFHTSCGGSTAKDWTPNPKLTETFPFDQDVPKVTHQSGVLYQSRLHGAVGFTVRGVVWYQGEDDGRNANYRQDFTDLIASWRRVWGRPELPFYFVQIAPTTYAGGMLGVWQAQSQVMDSVTNTGMAVSGDIYDGGPGRFKQDKLDTATGWPIAGGSNPHPPNRSLVADRLANIALAKTYNLNHGEVFGPMYASHKRSGNQMVITFKHVGTGLACNDKQPLTWFQVAGAAGGDKLNFVKADAKIEGKDTVILTTPGVDSPQEIRFAWHPLARHNLVNGQGLPAVSFRTDK